ncbi:MAG TPA: helix-turn-helix domain-containing protein [Ilumatobacteraceae bacterium]|nr:helix-turn-helix domain-containing protein [Ilumatobacteraceae bacterium]
MWRTFDVGAVAETLARDGAEIVAGRGGSTRIVSRAQIAATVDDLRRVGPHELIVVNQDTLLAVHDAWNVVIAGLHAAGVAALVVRCDRVGLLPAELAAAADRTDFPVIAVPGTAGLGDVTAIVLDALLATQRRRLDRFLEIHQRFTSIMLSGGGAAEIAMTLHALVEYPIVILDDAGRPIAAVPSDADLAAVTTSGVRQNISAGDHHYGEIVVLSGAVPIEDDRMLALERASIAIAVRLAHASAVAAEQERFAATTLEELIAGHAGGWTDVSERATSFGWDLSRPRAVLLASIDPPTDHSTLPVALATIAAAARATLGRDAIVWTRSSTIAALVAPASDSSSERRQLAESLRRELDDRLRAVTVSIGVGRRVDDPVLLPRSFLEASRAVDVGRWAKGRHVTEVFDELGLQRLLAFTPTDDLADFVDHSIGPLVEHDRVHGTDLVEMLSVWLETRNMAQAARHVHVHYNTFKNRLDRIESILGPVLTDAARTLECEVAIYVSRHYDGPWTSLRGV